MTVESFKRFFFCLLFLELRRLIAFFFPDGSALDVRPAGLVKHATIPTDYSAVAHFTLFKSGF